jgi:hypothetical protein
MKPVVLINVGIDSDNDGIDFELCLFNQGKYDKAHLRTIIRNIGARVRVTNKKDILIEIAAFKIGVPTSKNHVHFYSSSVLNRQFPKAMYFGELLEINFYGDEIKHILSKFKKEKAAFYVAIVGSPDTYHFSNTFDGDEIEELVKKLENEEKEYINWPDDRFYRLDIEEDIAIVKE